VVLRLSSPPRSDFRPFPALREAKIEGKQEQQQESFATPVFLRKGAGLIESSCEPNLSFCRCSIGRVDTFVGSLLLPTMMRKPTQDSRASRRGEEGAATATPLSRRGIAIELEKLKERRASSPGHTTHRRGCDDRQPGDEIRVDAGTAAEKEGAVVRSILKSRSSSSSSPSPPVTVALSSSTVARAQGQEEAMAAESRSSRCTFYSMRGDVGGSGLGGAGEGGIELDSKALNVSASGAFYERASSRRHRLKRALSENSASQAEAIPLGLGGGAGSGLAGKKHRTRGSLLAPELPEAAATAATVESTTKPALGVGAWKRAIGDVDPHWNAVLLRKKAREEMERQQLAKRWRGSITTHRNSESRTSSAESAVQSQNMSGTKSKGQSRCHPTGKMKDLKEQQSLYNKLATPRGIEGAAAGVARTSTPGPAKEAPRVERRTRPATAVRRRSAREPSVAQGVLALSSHGKPNGTGAAAGKTTVSRSGNTARQPHAPSQPDIITIDD
jgi:hypothetical protein